MLNPDHLGPAPAVPDSTDWSPALNAWHHTGDNATEAAAAVLTEDPRATAWDIEAAGLGPASFTIRCVTVSWDASDGTHVVLLDPRRCDHSQKIEDLARWAYMMVFHNSTYDIPPLYQNGLVPLDCLSKVWDTVIAARMAYPDNTVPKGLEALASRDDVLDLAPGDVKMASAFTAAGWTRQADGWAHADIDMAMYRLGAMADTVVTLRLAPVILEKVVKWITSNPLTPTEVGADTAYGLVDREQQVNRTMLRRSALGIRVDTDYLATYTEDNAVALQSARSVLEDVGLDPAAGNLGSLLVRHLEATGELPANWPRTKTGALSSAKVHMAALESHPLAVAHRKVADLSKVLGYLEKVKTSAEITGRVHPQVGILKATTGRMAYSLPELQQFNADARPILVPDDGKDWTSIDWSSIEPVVVANAAGDHDFLAGFNDHGADLYAPITESAGVTRKVAKVVVLAAMYGQGRALLASNLGVTEDKAMEIQNNVFAAMPRTRTFLDALRVTGDRTGLTMTADKRLLPIPKDPAGKTMGYKATNYFTQGSAYSVMAESIVAIEAAGLGDSIYLSMHDELVVDTEAAPEVQKIMETPPLWLEEFTGNRVVLRTDANPLNGAWRYV